MPVRITHHLSAKLCAFLYLRALFCFLASWLYIFPVSSVFSNDSLLSEKAVSKKPGESVYIILDQTVSPMKFGVAITPDEDIRYKNNQFYSSYLCPFDNDYKRTQHADVSTVVRIALDEFKLFSGFRQWVRGVEKAMAGYTRKLLITGELNLDTRNIEPSKYVKSVDLTAEIFKSENPMPVRKGKIHSITRQFEMNKLTWGMSFHLNRPELSIKLGIGEAIMIQSFAGDDAEVRIMIKLLI